MVPSSLLESSVFLCDLFGTKQKLPKFSILDSSDALCHFHKEDSQHMFSIHDPILRSSLHSSPSVGQSVSQ